jgi:hypothetical protein
MNDCQSPFCSQGLQIHFVITEAGFIGELEAPDRTPWRRAEAQGFALPNCCGIGELRREILIPLMGRGG